MTYEMLLPQCGQWELYSLAYLETVIDKDWPLVVLHLKDRFYTIHIHSDNKVHFGFFLPSFNHKKFNSDICNLLLSAHDTIPYMCQYYARNILEPVREAFSEAYLC